MSDHEVKVPPGVRCIYGLFLARVFLLFLALKCFFLRDFFTHNFYGVLSRVHQSVQNAHSVLARIACTVGCTSCTLGARVARPRTLFVIFETFHPSETNFRQFFEDIAL